MNNLNIEVPIKLQNVFEKHCETLINDMLNTKIIFKTYTPTQIINLIKTLTKFSNKSFKDFIDNGKFKIDSSQDPDISRIYDNLFNGVLKEDYNDMHCILLKFTFNIINSVRFISRQENLNFSCNFPQINILVNN